MNIFKSASLDFIEANIIELESSFTKGLPSFSIVGLVSTSISEAKDRVKAALLINEFKFPPLKITINLSPSEIKKTGSHFDLAIALHIALFDKKIKLIDNFFIFGELGLNGKIKNTNDIFPLVLDLKRKKKIDSILVCEDTAKLVSKIDGLNIYVVNDLKEAIEFFLCENKNNYLYEKSAFEFDNININDTKFYFQTDYKSDFINIIGQKNAKEAALISCAGFHNILFEGSPGCGKSMICKAMQYILPCLSQEEILENAKNLSFDSSNIKFTSIRPFRNPHHSSSKSSIYGGGSNKAKIGEIALANNGILFFDELPYFSKSTLEALREPLEDYQVLISRVNAKINYKTKFIFASAMNPCPCGNLFSKTKECRCNEVEIQRYKNKLSEPLLDRIDLYVQMNEVLEDDVHQISSAQLHEKVLDAFKIQKLRGQKDFNGKLDDKELKKVCILTSEAKDLLELAKKNFSLSFRSTNKLIKVARTVADLNKNVNIEKEDLLKALSFRKRD